MLISAENEGKTNLLVSSAWPSVPPSSSGRTSPIPLHQLPFSLKSLKTYIFAPFGPPNELYIASLPEDTYKHRTPFKLNFEIELRGAGRAVGGVAFEGRGNFSDDYESAQGEDLEWSGKAYCDLLRQANGESVGTDAW